MRRLVHFSCVALVVVSAVGIALAQSSGNFSYSTTGNGENPIACTLGSNGKISGGFQCVSSCTIDANGVSTCVPQSGDCMGNAVAGIKTSSGNGNVFVIRPSAVIGLLTDVTVSSKQTGSGTGAVSSSALAGVNFTVSVTGPGSPQVIPNFAVTYDSRYIQISTNLFQALATQCLAIEGGCFITFNESTVSAHSFDWIVTNLQSGTYTVTTSWTDSLGGSGISESLACVGPLNVTVQQNKIFNFNKPGGVVPINTP
jgi:hypothetical protein